MLILIQDFSAPLVELMQDDFVKEKAEEVARVIFTNNNVTINLIPAIIGLGLLALLAIPLLALLFQPAADTGGSGYGAPAAAYGAPESSYGSPEYRSVGAGAVRGQETYRWC